MVICENFHITSTKFIYNDFICVEPTPTFIDSFNEYFQYVEV